MLAQIIVNVLPDACLLLLADVEDFVFERLPLREIANDAGKDAAAAGKHRFTHREVDGKYGAVFTLSHHFTPNADDTLHTGAEVILHIDIVAVTIRLRHEHSDVLADDFIKCVAKETLSGCVCGLDDAVLIDRDDRVHRRLDNRRRALLTGLQRGL